MKSRFLIISIGLAIQNACVSTEAAYTLGGATVGGISGALASARNPGIIPLAAAGGTVAGGLLGGSFARSVKAGQRSAFTDGYQRGASDTVKRQYWILQNLQKERNPKEEAKWSVYKVPMESSNHRGAHAISIPILE